MNEKLKALYEQSMEPTGVEGIGGAYMELNPEKFAELIINECCELVRYIDAMEIHKHFEKR